MSKEFPKPTAAACTATDENVVQVTVIDGVEPNAAEGVKSWSPKFVPTSVVTEETVSATFGATD
jgi:hypothetical protein